MSKIVVVKTKEEGKIRARQERRENARRERDGLPTKELSKFKVQEERVTPKPKIPQKKMSVRQQKDLHKTLMKSVEVVDKDKVVDLSKEVEDNNPAELIRAEQLKERRKKALERRQKLKK